jgi:hypothetical protein
METGSTFEHMLKVRLGIETGRADQPDPRHHDPGTGGWLGLGILQAHERILNSRLGIS